MGDGLDGSAGWLVFPGPGGAERLHVPTHSDQRFFQRACERAGIGRVVRWHDLRHTCATSLLEGWWGEAWQPDEVRQFLGHTAVAMTMRYVHARGAVVFARAARAHRNFRETD